MGSHYALVAYVKDPVGEFIESLRRELCPNHPDWPAHITVLPPRLLNGTEEQALQVVDDVCQRVMPFDVEMGNAETFVPTTPTVFIRVAERAYRLRELHDHLNYGPLALDEHWPYMPHLTIAKLGTSEEALHVLDVARRRWAEYKGSRIIQIEELTFVREGSGSDWVDLAPVPLGRTLALR